METTTTAPKDGLTILVLEDSALDFELIREQLIDAGFTLIISCVDTEESFRASLRKNQYDIIISDFSLPDLTPSVHCGYAMKSVQILLLFVFPVPLAKK